MKQASRIPPKCTVAYLGSLPITEARRLADQRPADGSFVTYRLRFAPSGKRSRQADVYQYTPLTKGG